MLVLCMLANVFGSNWAQLEAGKFRFRDPLNRERRFISLRPGGASIKGSLAQLQYIDWRATGHELAYLRLREACRRPVRSSVTVVARELTSQHWMPSLPFDILIALWLSAEQHQTCEQGKLPFDMRSAAFLPYSNVNF